MSANPDTRTRGIYEENPILILKNGLKVIINKESREQVNECCKPTSLNPRAFACAVRSALQPEPDLGRSVEFNSADTAPCREADKVVDACALGRPQPRSARGGTPRRRPRQPASEVMSGNVEHDAAEGKRGGGNRCDVVWRVVVLATLAAQVAFFLAASERWARFDNEVAQVKRVVLDNTMAIEEVLSDVRAMGPADVAEPPVLADIAAAKGVVSRQKRRATYKDNRLPEEEEVEPVQNGNKSVPFHSISYITCDFRDQRGIKKSNSSEALIVAKIFSHYML
ncbi:unnamed protein product [Notodromas monacha]|uniref:Uncharacterized protein n=1 Tax=Notodromas monacha TaxID=399045 RepID=A0A7R9GGN1_9CRUS|nr:unnamed protein product [Notodromas monacha]CAG0920380.1 unnamed protein product [Notodromas monacha]